MVVEVLRKDHRVALGTVVGADGWILTKASEIPDDPRCRLANGEIVPARVTGVDAAFDLAMLKIDKSGLCAVEWSKVSAQAVGTFVAAPHIEGTPAAFGIISVSKRQLEGPFPTKVVKAPLRNPPPFWRPEIFCKTVEGKEFRVKGVVGSAAKSGICPGDVLLSINKRPILEHDDVMKCIQGCAPGDRILVELERAGKRAEIRLKLEPEPYLRCSAAVSPYRNFRSEDFPVFFEHDMRLTLNECGGPVIALDGKALGITIARQGEYGCVAIPADAVEVLVERLKTGHSDRPNPRSGAQCYRREQFLGRAKAMVRHPSR